MRELCLSCGLGENELTVVMLSSQIFSMIPYNQTQPKVISNEAFRVKACIKRVSESIDKRFCFDILPEYK